jgi:hypothetical protein
MLQMYMYSITAKPLMHTPLPQFIRYKVQLP